MSEEKLKEAQELIGKIKMQKEYIFKLEDCLKSEGYKGVRVSTSTDARDYINLPLGKDYAKFLLQTSINIERGKLWHMEHKFNKL